MPENIAFPVPHGDDPRLVYDGILIAGRKVFLIHQLEIVFELQGDILAGPYLRLELPVDIGTVEQVDFIQHFGQVGDAVHAQCMVVYTAQNALRVVNLDAHRQMCVYALRKQDLFVQ